MNRIVFTGGRNFKAEYAVVDVLIQLPSDAVIVTGGAKGLDTIAHKYAVEMGFETEVYPANWNRHGNAAGPLRNRQMAELDGVSMVVAFEGGRGTKNMVLTAKQLGIPVVEVSSDEFQGSAQQD